MNKHWPEPITVYQQKAYSLAGFEIQEIIEAGHAEDVNNTFFLHVDRLLDKDEKGYTVRDRTATRLQNTYNACAGLNIQSDTKLKGLLKEVEQLLGVLALMSNPSNELHVETIRREIQALLGES